MARRQRRDKQKTLAKAALFCCLHQAQAAVNVTAGENLFFV
ncbi:putative reverse transcriptase protein from putative prophage or plasmid, partial [Escherichia coli O104:H4 str. E92/11]